MKTSKPLSVVLSVLIALVVLTGSIAVPLLCRSFDYAHIGPMRLEDWGLTREEIQTAYGEMMDFCLGNREDFSAGVLGFSQSGADHFADVRGLFLLDLRVLKISVMGLGFLLGWCLAGKVRPHRFRNRGPGFWAARPPTIRKEAPSPAAAQNLTPYPDDALLHIDVFPF